MPKKPKLDQVRSAPGEFAWTARQGILDQMSLVWYFMQAVKQECPAVMDELARTALPAFRRAMKAVSTGFVTQLKSLANPGVIGQETLLKNWVASVEAPPALGSLWFVLDDWVRKYHLDLSVTVTALGERESHRLIFGISLATLAHWAKNSQARKRKDWCLMAPVGELADSASSALAPFQAPAWDPRFEKRSDARARLIKAVTDYMDGVDADFQARDWPRPARISVDHIRWLAKFQVKGTGYSTLANEENRDRATIKEGVEVAGKAVAGTDAAWKNWKRPTRAGRPKRR